MHAIRSLAREVAALADFAWKAIVGSLFVVAYGVLLVAVTAALVEADVWRGWPWVAFGTWFVIGAAVLVAWTCRMVAAQAGSRRDV